MTYAACQSLILKTPITPDRAIYPWIRLAREKGLDALAPLPRTGNTRSLTEEQEQEVARWIINGDPRQYGFDFGLWTRQIVSNLIEHRLGIKLSVNSVGRLLSRQNITPQKPLRRAYERDEKAVTDWVKNEYPKIQKAAKKANAQIFWLDEAGIRSDDLISYGVHKLVPAILWKSVVVITIYSTGYSEQLTVTTLA